MRCWKIYIESREYASLVGDPCLGEVEAETKEMAELIAIRNDFDHLHRAGVWAVETNEKLPT